MKQLKNKKKKQKQYVAADDELQLAMFQKLVYGNQQLEMKFNNTFNVVDQHEDDEKCPD